MHAGINCNLPAKIIVILLFSATTCCMISKQFGKSLHFYTHLSNTVSWTNKPKQLRLRKRTAHLNPHGCKTNSFDCDSAVIFSAG